MEKYYKNYHIFLFLSTITRGLVSVFSLVILYQKGYSLSDLFFFLFLLYAFGLFVNVISLRLNYKFVLVTSSLLYGICYLYLSVMKNTYSSLILFSLLLSISTYSYHVTRHYLALSILKKENLKTNQLVCMIYLGTIISSIIGTILISKLPILISGILILILSLISIYPVLTKKIKLKETRRSSIFKIKLSKSKIIFSILEQFKVIFLEIQPLFLYLSVKNKIWYVGVFNIITNLSSLIVVYFFSKRVERNNFKYLSLLLAIILFIKLHLKSGIFLLIIAFFEGIGIKIYENISLENLYELGENEIISYLSLEEIIFFLTKSLIIGIAYLFHFNLYLLLSICIIATLFSGFFIPQKKAP